MFVTAEDIFPPVIPAALGSMGICLVVAGQTECTLGAKANDCERSARTTPQLFKNQEDAGKPKVIGGFAETTKTEIRKSLPGSWASIDLECDFVVLLHSRIERHADQT
jgi:hypothetical protein